MKMDRGTKLLSSTRVSILVMNLNCLSRTITSEWQLGTICAQSHVNWTVHFYAIGPLKPSNHLLLPIQRIQTVKHGR